MTPTLPAADLTRSPECAALVAACAADAHYDDDTPRLALADWLQDNGDPDRAEFIRVQCELARIGLKPIDPSTTANKPTHRCKICGGLWTELPNEGGWSVSSKEFGKCCDNVAMGDQIARLTDEEKNWIIRESALLAAHEADWRHGWLARRTPTDDVVNGADVGDMWRHPVHFERGFITQIDANLADIFHEGRPTEWALACVRGEPFGRRFGIVDRPAWKSGKMWTCVGDNGAHPDLGRPLFGAICRSDHLGRFDSKAEAERVTGEFAWEVVRGWK